jgi:phage terminase large subunit-like protein
MKRKDVYVTRGSTFENYSLAAAALQTYRDRYEGTKLGRQELYGEVLDDIEGALWTHTVIDRQRIKRENLPELRRVVVALDPAVTTNDESAETGIIIAAKGEDGRYYILGDLSGRHSAELWARKAVHAYYEFKADRIVGEVNQGGDLIERMLRIIDPKITYKSVSATRGKIVRAEPIAALYEQGKVSHVGAFPALEDQMCTYAGTGKSPDRFDALVWALTELSSSSGAASWRIS